MISIIFVSKTNGMEEELFQSLFEEDFITRSLGSVVNRPDVALTELVANAWDAGATEVNIFIPEKKGDILYIEDNGMGMSSDDFKNRWMKLRYDRVKHQGKKVVFPDGQNFVRYAYGKNGIGRHGLLCFNSKYSVVSKKNNETINMLVSTGVDGIPLSATNSPFSCIPDPVLSKSHYTRLEVTVLKNLPDVDNIREIISTRFLHDPNFKITVNNISLNLEDLSSLIDNQDVVIPEHGITLKCYFIDTTKGSKKSIFQGIAFWQMGRLVGDPSWSLGKNIILDGRSAQAKRYTCVVRTNDLSEYIKEDWTGFKTHEVMDVVFENVERFVIENLSKVAQTTVNSATENLKPEIKKRYDGMNPIFRYQIKEVLTEVVKETPGVRQESIDTAMSALINLEQSQNGQELLRKLSELQPDDIDGLNQLLSKWSVKDALVVLNEIDRRISIIEAIRKLSDDKNTDELHVLHPMITEARWLFGPEYESSEYLSNNTIRTAVKKLFKDNNIVPESTNIKQRPDLVILPNSSISFTGVEDYTDDSELQRITKLLIIELKRGGFEITRKERDQLSGYVEDLIRSNTLENCIINAFVVGEKVADNIEKVHKCGDRDRGRIVAVEYSCLVDTAWKRMFGLRQKLASKYDDIPGMELYKEARLF